MAELRRELFENDRIQKLNRNAGYKLVASLASYADEYKGVEEVILDSANSEAVANVRFNKISKGGNFEVDPNLIDNFGQPALFTMNANDVSDLEKEVFVNHGFREVLGNDYESSIFGLCPTVKELEDFWERGGEVETAAKHSSDDALLSSMLRDTVPKDAEDHMEQAASEPSTDSFEVISERSKSQSPKPSSTSLLLQGNPALPSSLKTLFLLPDGSGSSSSYASIPRVNPSIAIVGLNCPYMKIPEQYNTGIEEVSAMYIHEIRRRQPHGPCALGGWSVGGIFAYHVAQQLTAEGNTVSDLILIDCPVARGLDHLPHRYYEYCDKVGLLGEGPNGVCRPPPSWLIGHFEACVNSLHSYVASPFFPVSEAPDVKIIWASEAIDEHCSPKAEHRPDDPEGLKLVTEARIDFGPNGWEKLLPESRFSYSKSKANHFSMMKGEPAEQLRQAIEETLTLPN